MQFVQMPILYIEDYFQNENLKTHNKHILPITNYRIKNDKDNKMCIFRTQSIQFFSGNSIDIVKLLFLYTST